MVEISVIIPVFNVENYLDKCLDSVCSQTFEDIEIICVNDGSTDRSGDILNEYAKKDSRIRIINQTNQSLGASRNNGLGQAKGRYIYFIDSDDYIDSKTLEKLRDNIISNDSDVVLFKFRNFDKNNNVHRRIVEFKIDRIFGDVDYSNFTFDYRDVKRHVLNSAFSACLKLYKKEFLDSFDDFYFPEGISFEDVPFHAKVMLRASKISFVPESLYYYRSNRNSILNSSLNAFDIFTVIDMVEDYLKQSGHFDELKDEFIFFKIAQILRYIVSTDSEEYFQRAKQEFERIEIKNEDSLKSYALDGYNQVLSSNSFLEFLSKHYRLKASKLKEKNRMLSKKNRHLRQTNRNLLASRSWKVTKPLRNLKNIKK